MSKTQSMLERLEGLLKYKKSKAFYADKLNISIDEVDALLAELRGTDTETDSDETTVRHNVEKGTIEVSAIYNQPPTPEQIIADHKINTDQYKLASYWSKQRKEGYLVSANFIKITQKESDLVDMAEVFKNFESPHNPIYKDETEFIGNDRACLIFNKQDAHYNKYDINGDNNIEKRFAQSYDAIRKIVSKASITSYIDKVIYIIGSDAFNSEWTDTTTKGTPQTNAVPYQKGFEMICKHEINCINLLLRYTESIEIVYMPGNHDEYVGWHMVNWLKAYYKNQGNIMFDDSPNYTKYGKYSNSAIQINHGDGMKPEKLAAIFPMEFKNQWSSCDYFYTFTGDKHHEISKDIYGVKFFQLPALSKAHSKWDSKHGYTTNKGEMIAFLITENEGVTDTYRQILK